MAHVLVVEDYEPLRWLAREYLESIGYRVAVAVDASSALAYLEGGAACDVVFSDLALPGGIDGCELTDRVRRMRNDLPVVLTSGHDAATLRGRVPADVPLLTKPYRLDALAAAISGALGR